MSFLDRDERREVRSIGWYILRWTLAVIVAGLLIGGGVWALNVATSGARGQGDGIVERNSADNWLDAQARFEENFAEYESTLVRIDNSYAAWQTKPDDLTLQQTYEGTKSYCLSLVADYNADARNFLREDFRASDLPDQISPDTCQETP